MAIPVIEQAKAQAQVLVPLIKALREEIGVERANKLSRRVLAEHFRTLGKAAWQKLSPEGAQKTLEKTWKSFAAGDALGYQVLKSSPEAFELNVTECQYAKFYQDLGEPELGFLLVCSQDDTFFEGYEGVRLTRTQTIMQGASHCDFRYRLRLG
jgi:hypothetical protein